jgi:hypothetical protein
MQALLAPVLCLIFRGAGRAVSLALILLWGYILCATYMAKLIPLYAGYDQPRSNIAALYAWYQATDVSDRLGATSIGSPQSVYLLTAGVVACCVFLVVALCRAAIPDQPGLR